MVAYLFCSLLLITNRLQNYLLPCPFKKLTGIDCPGCGFQRSVVALFRGDLTESWQLYPPTIPLLVLFTVSFIGSRYDFAFKNIAIKSLIYVAGGFVMIAYLNKMLR
ncbi:DUF2752 domain-containing protein (plasmid) [Pedobacter sp. BS3]|uniref:DUF2752 domain-containing protein n=1 Tax=Pedobacter sp. BS3 TaxID=2567937 RepID=UPI0011EE77A3|nr:DUF2752 domain-containing protein [Pedobacter sp. BS3]TZF85668.1 DUF2752 domain-containing protein [Pedobacter sp. BS3]